MPLIDVIRQGPAQRVIFYYPGEEGTYIEEPIVTLYENGMVHIIAREEEVTTHLKNCEIVWRTNAHEHPNHKLRVIRFEEKR